MGIKVGKVDTKLLGFLFHAWDIFADGRYAISALVITNSRTRPAFFTDLISSDLRSYA